MALPVLKTIEECGEYAKAVEPFIPQLYDLPGKVLENIADPTGLKQLYIETNPLISGLSISIFLGAVFLVVSEINRNFSQVDRMWSILPNLYIIHFAVWARVAGLPHSRLDLISAFSTLWSIRLTFNYWRKGGYTVGSEDYRWEILQGYVPKFVWFIFNVTFISFYQSMLLFFFSGVPAYTILLSTKFDPHITTADQFYFLIEAALVVSEWFSDGQMWSYQTTKHQYYKDDKVPEGYCQADLDRGFITTGLFAYSRHPNFFAEQSIWFMLYQWSCYATNNLYNYAGAGSLQLFLLFQGSTWLTEAITAGKYPDYKDYQKHVGMFIPTSLKPYNAPPPQPKEPKVIRTSEIAKHMEAKKQK